LIVARSYSPAQYGKSVFLNCPFDDEYRPIFRAIVFTVAAKIALTAQNAWSMFCESFGFSI
jgi:hypothetical protein